ncbi:MAG: hypothetical protein ACYC61_20595 [Isosphaeraceae bacterium]
MQQGPPLLAEVAEGRWRPGIGDPTVMGWVTVIVYLLASAACARAALREPMADGTRRPPSRPSRFWLALAVLLLALGINKQLDLQSLATQIGRDVIRAWGLYSARRELQVGFILAVVLVCAGTLGWFFWAARATLERRWLAVLGTMFILGFVVVRAASFHHVDAFIGSRLGGAKWNWILELGGIAIVGAAAVRALLSPPTRPSRTEGATTYRYRVNSR